MMLGDHFRENYPQVFFRLKKRGFSKQWTTLTLFLGSIMTLINTKKSSTRKLNTPTMSDDFEFKKEPVSV